MQLLQNQRHQGGFLGKMRKVKFVDVIEINPYRKLDKGELSPYIPMGNLGEGKRTIQVINYREYKNSGSKFVNGDTLLARITPCLENGKTAFVDKLKVNQVAHGSTEFIVLRGKEGLTDNLFVYYLVRSTKFRNYAIKSMTGSSGRQRVQTSAIENYEIELPSLEEQKRIAHILGTLDDKIELNQKINHTLEAIARAIFQSWFVDFDPVRAKMAGEPYPLPDEIMALFPDELVESELGMIPKGWNFNKLKSFGKIVTGKTPSTKVEEYYDSQDIPFIKIPDMHNSLVINKTKNYLSKKGAKSQSNKYLPPDTICVSCIATSGLVSLTSKLSQSNQQINSIIPENENYSMFLLFSMVRKGQEIKLAGSGGSVVNNLNKKEFSDMKILCPEEGIIIEFEILIKLMISRIKELQIEKQILFDLRELLSFILI